MSISSIDPWLQEGQQPGDRDQAREAVEKGMVGAVMLKLHSDEEQTQDKDRKGWLDKYVDGYERDAGYIAEGLALRLIEQAIRIMADKGISRSDLASLMGVSRVHITRMFNAP